jgi:hypothetical protein
MSGKDCGTDCATAELLEDPEITVVMRGALADLQRGCDRLDQRGIDSTIVRGDTDDGAGCCSTKLYLVVAREDAPHAFAVFDSEWKRGLTGEQIAALEAASEVVIDPDAPETTCPACLTTFATGPGECPDCGLALG